MLHRNKKLEIHSIFAVVIQDCHVKETFDVFCLIPVAGLRSVNGSVKEHNKRKQSVIELFKDKMSCFQDEAVSSEIFKSK